MVKIEKEFSQSFFGAQLLFRNDLGWLVSFAEIWYFFLTNSYEYTMKFRSLP